ncbi:MAG: hypothetical protein KDB50_08525, partial [Mycobacterium sp.]|nr:hypothetical protein [Mycobacterium sp.]
LGIAAGAKRPGAKKSTAPAEPASQAAAPAPTEPTTEPAAEPATAPTPPAPVKGLGIAAGARRPGAKKPATP